jgi:hypothetical protein
MKRTALALAAAFLGTGCIMTDDHCDVRDVTVYWSGFDGPGAAAIDRSCAGAGVTYVDLFLDGRQVWGDVGDGHFRCDAYGVTILDVPAGSRLTTEGLAADGRTILYRDDRALSTSCGSFSVTVAPAAGFADLAYVFSSGGVPLGSQQCSGPYLWLSVFDHVTGAQAVLADADFQPTAYACVGQGTPLSFALPVGSYTLQWMEERGPASGYTLESADCTDRPIPVAARAATTVPVSLDVNATAACP